MTERRNHLILVALIMLAVIGAALLAAPGSPLQRKPVLGLDLQGGLEVVLKAVPPEGRPLRESDLNRSVDIIRNRIDKLGVAEPEVRKQGRDQISASLPGVRDPDRVRDIIGSTAQLELYDLQTAATGPSIDAQGFNVVAQPSLYDLLSSAATQALMDKGGEAGPYYLFEQKTKRLVAGPLRTRAALLQTEAAQRAFRGEAPAPTGSANDGGSSEGGTVGGGAGGSAARKGGPGPNETTAGGNGGRAGRADEVPAGYKVFAVPPNTVVITCGVRQVVCPGVGTPTSTSYYLFKHTPNVEKLEQRFPQMTGEHLQLSGTRADFDPQQGAIVLMRFTGEGARIFHEITRAEAQRGQQFYSLYGQGGEPDAYNQNFAIVLDREIRSFPSIDFEQYPDGISGENGAQITGLDSPQEAKDLALVLQTGALPVKFVTLSETQVSATLGEDSLREALIAALVGMAVVALFLLVAYRFLGLVAVLGLGIYALFLYTVILLFNVTLTLPGFAGMILTIGVAADANIVIFERIKEESRAGKSVRAAIGAGYGKGFSTIIDANVVTAITALILFGLATAGVRGFALMLLIGTAMSLVTAVFATRAMLGLLAGFRWFDSPAFMGAGGTQISRWIQHDYVGLRRYWFGFSAVVLALALGALAVKGLNLGIDFEGGTKISFSTPRPTSLESVRDHAERIGEGNAQIQGVGAASGGRYREFTMRAEALAPREQAQLRRNLQEAVGATDFGVTTVSASFGRQIAVSAIWAILLSLGLVVLYITFRFAWKFALATMVALLHDVLIAVGIYALLGREVTTATVAAVLTVLGYSIYDSIIILDRVRENIPLMRRASFATIGNVSLWETIRRSLATTFITLLPITALYLFGGETLKDFAFALLVGIGSGAYSSIFLAVPLVAVLKEREPEYAKRRDGAVAAEDAEVAIAEATAAAADEPVPALAPLTPAERAATNAAKRERRRQRRRARPHGRAR